MEALLNSEALVIGLPVLFLGILTSLGAMYLPTRMLVALPLLEINRIFLKLFLWVSLLTFLLIELAFSAVFLGVRMVTNQTSFLFTRFFGLFEPVSDFGGWETWGAISLVIFLIVMIPFMAVSFTISKRFKLTAFQIVMPRITSCDKVEIQSFSAGKMMPKPFVKGFVAARVRTAVRKSTTVAAG